LPRRSTGGSREALSCTARSPGTAQSRRADETHASWVRDRSTDDGKGRNKLVMSCRRSTRSARLQSVSLVHGLISLAGSQRLNRTTSRSDLMRPIPTPRIWAQTSAGEGEFRMSAAARSHPLVESRPGAKVFNCWRPHAHATHGKTPSSITTGPERILWNHRGLVVEKKRSRAHCELRDLICLCGLARPHLLLRGGCFATQLQRIGIT
jgi:hypothetical protein